ncbi:MAG: hypothetical protein M1828_007483 [Chrysothrix sp. TS-e1954]|nr:MAG: hypothetical protein M1828_007483 [Chrysothrix sp. TS-e1954]
MSSADVKDSNNNNNNISNVKREGAYLNHLMRSGFGFGFIAMYPIALARFSPLNHTLPTSCDRSITDSDGPIKTRQSPVNRITIQEVPLRLDLPLAPPPKPSQQQNAGETPDYFSEGPSGGSHFSLEPNPFEQSFGNPAETPGKFNGLPSVASLTSPAPLGPGGTPNWQNSLRSGPLSPAMLPGPQQSNGYFDESFRGSFPTPNESSLRTGLTPGGAGSLFPAPSPNSQAIFNTLQNGGATPGTLEFQRAAINAAARSKADANTTNTNGNSANGNPASATNNSSNNNNNAPTMPSNSNNINKQEYQPAQQQQQGPQDPFGSQPESEAVNSLFLLSNSNRNSNQNNANQFAVPNQSHNMSQNAQMQSRMSAQQQGASPTQHRQGQVSIDSTGSLEGDYDGEDGNGDSKSSSRKGKKGAKAGQPANGRRKAEETPGKMSPNKRARVSSGMSMDDDDDGMSNDADSPDMDNGLTASGRKMTDEEKRKNFLERNRVAALKCRQRKKQWLANLQTKVEIFTSENDALSAQCTQLREEIMNLKTLLLAHKDCPVSHQQGIAGNTMAQVIGDFNPHAYGMMPNGQQVMGMQGGQGTTATLPPTPDTFTENHHFLDILQSVLAVHAAEDPGVKAQAKAFASTGGSSLGAGGAASTSNPNTPSRNRRQRSTPRTSSGGAGGASAQGGPGGGSVGGFIHLSDSRNPPDWGRVAWPEDILGSLEVDGEGEIVGDGGGYMRSGTYRVCTNEGVFGLSAWLVGRVRERLVVEEQSERRP